MSASQALTKLTIAHLRGSVGSFVLPFERGKNLTVVYGENGTGKSTICDALEMLGKGTVGSLDNRGLGRTYGYWNTISKTAADVAVILETANTACRATIAQGKVNVHPFGAQPRVEVLRRSQILKLLEAQPGDRYKEIHQFIDVTGVEASEKALYQEIRDLNGRLNVAAVQLNANIGELQRLAMAAGQSATGALEWAREAVNRDALTDDSELRALRALQSAYERLGAYPVNLLSAEQAEQQAGNTADSARMRLESALQMAAEGAQAVFEILSAAQTYLGQIPDPMVCPLCERAEGIDGLSARVAERLHTFESFQRAKGDQRRAEGEVERARQEGARLNSQLQRDIDVFDRACDEFAWSDDVVLPDRPVPQGRVALAAWLAATTDVAARWQTAEANRQEQQQFRTALHGALLEYDENRETSDYLNAPAHRFSHSRAPRYHPCPRSSPCDPSSAPSPGGCTRRAGGQ